MPHAEDEKLVDELQTLYRLNATVGSGSTADTIRYERQTGQPVGGRWHDIKGREAITSLNKWLRKHPTASAGDRAAAENVIKDLEDALK